MTYYKHTVINLPQTISILHFSSLHQYPFQELDVPPGQQSPMPLCQAWVVTKVRLEEVQVQKWL